LTVYLNPPHISRQQPISTTECPPQIAITIFPIGLGLKYPIFSPPNPHFLWRTNSIPVYKMEFKFIVQPSPQKKFTANRRWETNKLLVE
jgi:hypothetical protein